LISSPFSTNFDDVKGLTESMLLITALLMTFSFNGIQNLSHEDYFEADTRLFRIYNISSITDVWEIPSFRYIKQIMESLKYLHIVLVLGMSMYLSLAFSKCAEHPDLWPYWSSGFSACIMIGYVLLVYAVVLLLSAGSALADMVFPRYSWNLQDIIDPTNKEVTEGKGYPNWLLQRQYQESTRSIVVCAISTAAAVLGLHICSAVWSEEKLRSIGGELFRFRLLEWANVLKHKVSLQMGRCLTSRTNTSTLSPQSFLPAFLRIMRKFCGGKN
jgi:hypothetical protein